MNYSQDMSSLVDRFTKNINQVSLSSLFFDADKQMDFTPFLNFAQELDACESYKIIPSKVYKDYDCYGNNFLHIAETLGLFQLASALYEQAPKLALSSNQFGQYPVHFAAYHNGHLQKYESSLLHKVDDRQMDVLNISASCGAVGNIAYLLENSDLLVHQNSFGSFSLHGACNHYVQDAATKARKIIIARELMYRLGSRQVKIQLEHNNSFGMSPSKWLEKTLNSKEIDAVYSCML